jgi:voltage-gated potassium channel
METQQRRIQESSRIKQSAYYASENPLKGGPVAKFFGIALLVLIIINALLVFVTDDPNFSDTTRFSFNLIASASTLFFGIEYAVRLWIADLVYPSLSPGKARLRYAFSLMGIIDFLAFAPGLLAFFIPVSSQILHSIRIIRLVRLMKLTRYMKGLHSIALVFSKRRSEIIAAFVVLGLLTVTASVLMFALENPVQPEKFDSVFTGMYWAMTTITTTGYGDLVPITAAGRLLGFVVMVLAIGAVAIPAGIFSAGFVAEFRSEDVRAKVQDVRQDSQDSESTD